MTGMARQRAAWDTYQALVVGLLPALGNGDRDEPRDDAVNPRLGAVVIRIRRYTPMWEHDGPILPATADSAVRLLRHGDRDGLTGLAQATAHRLLPVAARHSHPPHPGLGNQKTVGGRRVEWGLGLPPNARRNMRHRRHKQHEKGIHDD